jgi:hypothetical protein
VSRPVFERRHKLRVEQNGGPGGNLGNFNIPGLEGFGKSINFIATNRGRI